MIYAFTEPQANCRAVLVFLDIAYPYADLGRARETAKKVGIPGFWRLKSLKEKRA